VRQSSSSLGVPYFSKSKQHLLVKVLLTFGKFRIILSKLMMMAIDPPSSPMRRQIRAKDKIRLLAKHEKSDLYLKKIAGKLHFTIDVVKM
jgi:hypothetical protein